MIILLFFIGVLLGLLLWLLLSPIQLQVDTRRNEYALRWVGVASARILPVEDDLLLRLRLPFWRRDFSLLKLLAKSSNKTKPTRTRKAKPKQPATNWRFFTFRRFRNVLKSFRVRYFQLELDTDDYVTNAYWYPVFYFLNTPTRSVAINFQGRNRCAFLVENRVANVLWALIF